MTSRLQSETDYLAAFQKRHEYCRVLLELSCEQKTCIEQTNTTELLEVLNRKQRILDEYQKLRDDQPQLAEHWKSVRDSFSPQTRTVCDSFLEETESMFYQLLDNEKHCTEELTEQKTNTEAQLRRVTAGAAAHHSYQDDNLNTSPQHLDINQ